MTFHRRRIAISLPVPERQMESSRWEEELIMPSEDYRYYRLDGDGRLHFAKWFSAASDEQATEQVQANYPNAKCEIWQGRRLVAKLSPSQFSPDDPDLQNAVGKRLSALALRLE